MRGSCLFCEDNMCGTRYTAVFQSDQKPSENIERLSSIMVLSSKRAEKNAETEEEPH